MGNQDFVWGVALMLSGVFVALAAVKYGLSRIIKEVSSESQNDWAFPRWWSSVVNYIVPALGAILLFWWMYQSATVYAPDDWYDPTSLYSVATCVVQWAIALAAFYMLNHWMNHRLENSIES
jgi:NSS family neurotransmitter:Na+ symporter